ncbi:MAG: IS3-like element ISAar46 family transposase, partial [Acidimicrobiales bacterium]
IALPTPATVHTGRTARVQAARAATLEAAWRQHPERFGRKPTPLRMPTEAWINDPSREANIKAA